MLRDRRRRRRHHRCEARRQIAHPSHAEERPPRLLQPLGFETDQSHRREAAPCRLPLRDENLERRLQHAERQEGRILVAQRLALEGRRIDVEGTRLPTAVDATDASALLPSLVHRPRSSRGSSGLSPALASASAMARRRKLRYSMSRVAEAAPGSCDLPNRPPSAASATKRHRAKKGSISRSGSSSKANRRSFSARAPKPVTRTTPAPLWISSRSGRTAPVPRSMSSPRRFSWSDMGRPEIDDTRN